ncbi:MAG: carboxypeptidase regulatory-like domain-containing protein [Deltaproteobacteria bacterium]|nr:carboxypeptidase regulatory-like domain-containing protein [Deltaproteobacteria bacterium]
MNARVPFLVLALLVAAACHPLALDGESCAKGPCAAGLTCVDEVCTFVEPPTPPPPPCESDEQCVLDGTADGRVCTDGVCGYADCTFDLQCGVRICDDGQCADRHPCFTEEDCEQGQLCSDGVCRTPCLVDEQCAILGGVLQVCVEGECRQRCLGDFMCLGGICEENVCLDPQCAVDEDCPPGDFFCDAGRCTAFTPCAEDDDCFDANFSCNELGRCEERPLCDIDAECGADRCVDGHCRPAVPCSADDCGDGLECVAGRCVEAPACRASADCSGGDVCDGGRCVDAPAAVAPAAVVVATPQGACPGACELVLLVGESVQLRAQGFDADGRPVPGPITPVTTMTNANAATITTLTADTAGDFPVAFGDTTLTVRVRARPAGALVVIAVDGGSGAPVAGATVFLGTTSVGFTDASGVYAVGVLAPDEDVVAVRSVDGRGVALVGALAGAPDRLRLPLAPVVDQTSAAGFRATVNGTGDELGDTGVSLALPAATSAAEATPATLFGPPFAAVIGLPLIGDLPTALPASVMLDGTVPVVGFQDVKPEALVTAPPGPGPVLAYEGRYDQQLLLTIAFGADPVELALDLAAQTEGMDVLADGAGLLEALPLVVDGDAADGVEDVDGDGDVGELVPDYYAFPDLALTPSASPSLRVGLRVSAPPAGANARAFAVCGVDAGLFLPAGISSLYGTEEDSRGEQLVALAPPAALEGAPRRCAVHAVYFGDSIASFAQVSGELSPLMEVGELLAPPEGAFLIEDVPTAGRTSVVIPGGTATDLVRARVFDGGTTWDVIGAGGDLTLPDMVVPFVLFETSVIMVDGTPFVAFEAPLGPLELWAQAVATAR